MAQDESTTGHCKHGEFDLLTGCPQCMAEAEAERQGVDPNYEAMMADRPTEIELPTADEPPVAQVAKLFGNEADQVILDEEPGLDPLSKPDWPREPGTALIKVGVDLDESAQRLHREGLAALECAKRRVIQKKEDLELATNDLAIIKNLREALEDKKKDYVGPIRDHLDAVNEAFKQLLAPFVEADQITRDKVKEYRIEQQKKADEAAAIEAEKLNLARREAEYSGTGEISVELGTVEAPPPVPKTVRTDVGTSGGRVQWKWRMVDFALVPDEYKILNHSLLTSFARSTKGQREIPGIEIYPDTVVTVRSKK